MRGIAEGIVAADRDQVIEIQLFDVLQHPRRHVIDGGGHAAFWYSARRESLAARNAGTFLHLQRIGARAMQPRAAGAVDGAGVLAVERNDVARDAGGIVEIEVGEPFPAAPDTGHLGPAAAAR